MAARGTALVKLEREERRTVEDARRARNSLIALSSFADIDTLAALGQSKQRSAIQAAFAELELCISRALELQAERRELETA